MCIVVIDGKRLDTEKARKKWSLDYHDGSNMYHGSLYLSSRGTWYVWTPSQWANMHRWELVDPTDAIGQYGRGLSDEERAEILELAGDATE